MIETNLKLTSSLPSNIEDENGIYFSNGNDFDIYLPYRSYFINKISDNISYTHDNIETTVYQRIWDVYQLKCVLPESLAKDLTALVGSKNISITLLSFNQTLQADTTKSDFTTFTLTQIASSALLLFDMTFRVSAFTVDHTIPENENYQIILYNKNVRSGTFASPDSAFFNNFGYSKLFYTNFYPILDEAPTQTDNLQLDFIDFATRLTGKRLINLLFFLNESDKNILKRYTTLCNASVFVDKTKANVLFGQVKTNPLNPSRLISSAADFLNLAPGMFIYVGSESYKITQIFSSTELEIEYTSTILDFTDAYTNTFYPFAGVTIPESTQVAKNLYDVKIIAIYQNETNYYQ